jgi:hypothetical protein
MMSLDELCSRVSALTPEQTLKVSLSAGTIHAIEIESKYDYTSWWNWISSTLIGNGSSTPEIYIYGKDIHLNRTLVEHIQRSLENLHPTATIIPQLYGPPAPPAITPHAE